MKMKERTNKKTKEMLKEDWLTISCAHVYISAPEEDMFSVVHEGKHKTTFFFVAVETQLTRCLSNK